MALEGIRCFGEDIMTAWKSKEGKGVLIATIAFSIIAAFGHTVPGYCASGFFGLMGFMTFWIIGNVKNHSDFHLQAKRLARSRA